MKIFRNQLKKNKRTMMIQKLNKNKVRIYKLKLIIYYLQIKMKLIFNINKSKFSINLIKFDESLLLICIKIFKNYYTIKIFKIK